MKASSIYRCYTLFALLFLGQTAHADSIQREIIQLQHKQGQEIISLVRPFLDENGTIAAEGDSVIVETTAANLQQIKILIKELDVPAKQLHISVSLDPKVMLQSQSTDKPRSSQQNDNTPEVTKPTVAPDSSLVYKTEGREVSPGTQVIKVLQDHWTMIRTGHSVPIIKRVRNPDGSMTESISYQHINQGLRIKPRLTGLEVVLYVQPFYEADNTAGPGKKIYYKEEKVAHTIVGSWFGLETTSGSKIPITKDWLQQNRLASEPVNLIFLKVDVAP